MIGKDDRQVDFRLLRPEHLRMKHQDRKLSLHHAEIMLVTVVVGVALACASKPDNRPHDNLPPPPAAKPPASPPPKREAKVAESPEAVAARLGVDPAQFK